MNKTAMLCALAAGSLWGCMGFFTRTLSAEFGFVSPQITSLRLIVAAISFIFAALIFDRSRFRVKPRDLILLCAMGVSGVMMTSLTYFLSMTHSSMAVAAILMYTAPAMVIAASRVLFKEKITKRKLAALILAFAGCCFVSGIMNGNLSLTPMGIILGLLSGVFYGSYSIFGTYALRRHNSKTITLWAFIFAAASSLFVIDIPDAVSKMTASQNVLKMAVLIISMGVMTGFLPYLLYTKALERAEASKAIIVASVEPLVAALIGFLLYNEVLTVYSSIGIVLIIISVVLTT